MYDQYTEWIREKDEVPVSNSMYRSIFVSDFNLGFGNPRTDTCSRCEMLSGDALADHKARADEAFRPQAVDRQTARNGCAVYVTFDLQKKTLPLPKLSVVEAFYMCQLWLYNTGIHAITADKEGPFFHIWTEAEGHRS